MEEKQQKHIPVLMKEVLHYLDPKPGKVYIDVTLGGGGHTRMILDAEPACTVIGFDWDKSVIDTTGEKLKEEYPGRFIPMWGNFSRIDKIIKKTGHSSVDGILADFGTSQIQIFETAGLSLYKDTFLDMRMSNAFYKLRAYDVINFYPEKKIADILFEYGEERASRKIAQRICEERRGKRLKMTSELVDIVESVLGGKYKNKIHPATRTFQALRIYVNKELENIESFLVNAMTVMNDEARLVCISFHSLEDRIVKQFFKNRNERNYPNSYLSILTKKVCTADEEELKENRSSRSAKLRAAIFHKKV